MARKGFKRVAITVKAEQWDQLQETLLERGFPPGTMSHYLGGCLNELEACLSGEPTEAVTPLQELQIREHLRKNEPPF